MDVLSNVTSSFPVLMGFCSGLTILGGIITASFSFAIKSHLKTARQNEKYKDESIQNKITAAANELKVSMERLNGEFRALQVEVKASLLGIEKANAEQVRRYEQSINAIKVIFQKSENKFEIFQRELKEVRVLVERIKKVAP